MSLDTDKLSNHEKAPQLRILVVDDDILSRRLMQVLLTYEGHEVDVAANGLEAFDAIKYKQFDIVLMDLQMPIMDGLEASRQIRDWENGGQHTFIVALTADYLPEEGHRLFEVGIDNYISKPFEMEHLQRLLKYIMDAHSASSLNRDMVYEKEAPPNEVPDIAKKQGP